MPIENYISVKCCKSILLQLSNVILKTQRKKVYCICPYFCLLCMLCLASWCSKILFYHFLSIWITSCSHSFRLTHSLSFLVTHSFSILSSENILFPFIFGRIVFFLPKYKILGCWYFFPSTWTFCHLLLASVVSDMKSTVINCFVPVFLWKISRFS